MPDSYTHENGTVDHALFANQKHWMWEGYGVINGCAPTAGDGDWGVDVGGGEVLVGDTSADVAATTKTLTPPNNNPRWDVVWADSDGTVKVTEGVEQPPDQDDSGTRLTHLQTRYPTPDDLSGRARVVLGIVWVDPQLGPPLSDNDVVDRRTDATTPINTRNLSDDAVTAAKLAANAVSSDEIDDDAVGVGELANALGTDSNNKIPGTTHFENANTEALEAQQASVSDYDAEMWLGTTQNIDSGVATVIAFDNIKDEDQNVVAADPTTGEFTAEQNGTYRVECIIRWQGDSSWSTGDVARLRINKNGSGKIDNSDIKVGTNLQGSQIGWELPASQGDVFTVDAFQESGLTQSIDNGSSRSLMGVRRVA